ncbi:flagellar assembly peptidoglycan hydrolase FlgJ [Accumulibacter sp.]|uniref:flagellar assembly peptidoglycan hydrolase FlgJ n=1 Tax=Accumulibacter sp. TaxID=2053492 RepID=UPI0025CCC21C|nr:flagellar assembly peptidoglycan hydrolase FlgJ [Accumulibacter sp.]MCM8596244.1 flagellar assembly peptidoglycan hydrolase FlgJ [Accumulibacter sp.]MCM8627175.1 flagellar assembly peptidoglycan hydrolase FlgJ [Accumulibacter sp.]MDS4050393.1 flagellar assembly peptidoglycan hydrolase FlgJ [Accumulibacter sp.]
MRAGDSGLQRLAVDPAAAADLRLRLRNDPQSGIRQTARQFEGLLIQLMLRSMRQATPASSLLDGEQSRFFAEIGDQQLAQDLASRTPIGFSALIERQLARQAGRGSADLAAVAGGAPLVAPPPAQPARPAIGPAAGNAQRPMAPGQPTAADRPATTREFVDRVWPHAVEAAAMTGIPAHFLVAQSALESGWGRREIRRADGSPSFNLFGVKAGRSWTGPCVEVNTTEFANGVWQSGRARFRAYESYAEAFRDYARLMTGNPRFAGVVGQQDGAQFARALQQAGYATDPMYAAKLARIIDSTSLRQALVA